MRADCGCVGCRLCACICVCCCLVVVCGGHCAVCCWKKGATGMARPVAESAGTGAAAQKQQQQQSELRSLCRKQLQSIVHAHRALSMAAAAVASAAARVTLHVACALDRKCVAHVRVAPRPVPPPLAVCSASFGCLQLPGVLPCDGRGLRVARRLLAFKARTRARSVVRQSRAERRGGLRASKDERRTNEGGRGKMHADKHSLQATRRTPSKPFSARIAHAVG